MNPVSFVLIALGLGASAALAAKRTTGVLHMWQMDSYIVSRYLKWMAAKPAERFFDPLGLGLGVALIAASFFVPHAEWLLLLWAGYCAWRIAQKEVRDAKKPLDYTVRAKRTLLVARILLFLAAAVITPLTCVSGAFITAVCLIHAAPGAVLLANILLKPVQAHINRGFVKKAAARLAEYKPLVVGVAGSYGKTSTKFFTATLLAERFNVIKSPGNYNTLLGITRVVNDMLQPDHRIFVAEMGAYKRGEVKEIAELVHPKIGIISSIGPEHFERFLSMENIEKTNYELIDSLPSDGLAVFNGENEHCRKLAAQTRHTRVALYSLDNRDGSSDLWAEGIEHGPEGLKFTIVTRDGSRIPAAAPIVGRHMVLNILGAARIAMELGVTHDEIARGITKLQSAPNRLELKQGAGGTIIIDDSYNSNPVGAAEALHVLSQFKTGRRILVTPGMIELGVLHEQKNEEFGFEAARSADFVILVGPNQTKPIQAGLKRGGFAEQNLRIVRNLSEATTIFQKMLRPGDVLLFENDLPDLYDEN